MMETGQTGYIAPASASGRGRSDSVLTIWQHSQTRARAGPVHHGDLAAAAVNQAGAPGSVDGAAFGGIIGHEVSQNDGWSDRDAPARLFAATCQSF